MNVLLNFLWNGWEVLEELEILVFRSGCLVEMMCDELFGLNVNSMFKLFEFVVMDVWFVFVIGDGVVYFLEFDIFYVYVNGDFNLVELLFGLFVGVGVVNVGRGRLGCFIDGVMF